MDALTLARWQFAITTVYHFFFVPITLGLSIAVAIMQTAYYRTGNEAYKKMTKFWGKLFLINFAIGVVTGIVQEFQFGMNWSQYSRFMGDIFGAPLAIEALLAFFMESTFLGIWIFGWERVSKKIHLASIWLVAIGSNLSAIWILAANSFMQQPVGYAVRNGRAEMTDFFAIITNGHLWVQFPHVFFGALATAGFLILAISAYQLVKKGKHEVFKKSFKFGAVYALVGSLLVILLGHTQAQYMIKVQPMKMAAAEALWESENPASMSLFTFGDEKNRKDVFAIKIPGALSFLAYNKFEGEVKGIKNLQAEAEQKFGPGDYVPPVAVSYWTFRIMVGVGFLMLLIAILTTIQAYKTKFEFKPLWYKIVFWSMFLPTIANTAGWIFTEIARQPWTVFGLFKTADSVSNTVSAGEVGFSLIAYTVIYAILIVVMVGLMKKYASRDVDEIEKEEKEVNNSVLSKA
ncbi:Cytochrome bd-I oxidase subunit I [Ignavibacterium album JCM 16511]|uniref:Cytochrome bd-I oxidase subunit I n=1 Tax=Ignavibacterium album (strain DSM 19864 / JCM 16511 / NBRC 101810 / Mat9-16) TaxID=945713 RepID=I0AIK2_IGNAJ|nr:cytochrome ubiquinol oxidase subunit I [Ignavibacterium album]AFH48809.1 Cytochrome bd-I oxidase subunit I [Ignavibacterium album JCM 16511]